MKKIDCEYSYNVIDRSDREVRIEVYVQAYNLRFVLVNPPISIDAYDISFICDLKSNEKIEWLVALHKYSLLDFDYESSNRLVRIAWAKTTKTLKDRLDKYIRKNIVAKINAQNGQKGGVASQAKKRALLEGNSYGTNVSDTTIESNNASKIEPTEQPASGAQAIREQIASNNKNSNYNSNSNDNYNNKTKNAVSNIKGTEEEAIINYFDYYLWLLPQIEKTCYNISDVQCSQLMYYLTTYDKDKIPEILEKIKRGDFAQYIEAFKRRKPLISWEAWRGIRAICGYTEHIADRTLRLGYDSESRRRLFDIMMSSSYDSPWDELFVVFSSIRDSAKDPIGIIYTHFKKAQ